jgi:hypothetical protein
VKDINPTELPAVDSAPAVDAANFPITNPITEIATNVPTIDPTVDADSRIRELLKENVWVDSFELGSDPVRLQVNRKELKKLMCKSLARSSPRYTKPTSADTVN